MGMIHDYREKLTYFTFEPWVCLLATRNPYWIYDYFKKFVYFHLRKIASFINLICSCLLTNSCELAGYDICAVVRQETRIFFVP